MVEEFPFLLVHLWVEEFPFLLVHLWVEEFPFLLVHLWVEEFPFLRPFTYGWKNSPSYGRSPMGGRIPLPTAVPSEQLRLIRSMAGENDYGGKIPLHAVISLWWKNSPARDQGALNPGVGDCVYF
jgi:hypothetical protein